MSVAEPCGGGTLEPGEQCDDGDVSFLDGCTPTCTVEAGWACTGSPSVCTETCGFGAGNGVVNAGEECDDGFPNENGDGCTSNCFIEAGWSCGGAPSVCTQICGDGIVTAGQQCDDDDTDNGDGCSSTCTIEAGWVCSGVPSTCANTCGDGNVDAGEQCDDMDTGGGDGCSPICRLESGWSCSGAPSSCAATCGNGSLQAGEDCDDGDTNNGNGCSNICRESPGFACDASQPSICTSVCGDGVRVKIAEDCEDGCLVGTPNVCEPADDGDGCEANCTLTEKSVSDTVGAGGTVTTDIEGDGATITDPLEVAITSPVAGTITITRRATSTPAPSGFTYAGQEVDITAPAATVADPHVIVFRLHPDLVPEGLIGVVEILTVFKDGVTIPNCTAPGTGDAVPDPCVASRVTLSDMDFQITVFSSTASVWNFGFEITALPLLSPEAALLLAALLVLALGMLLRRRAVG